MRCESRPCVDDGVQTKTSDYDASADDECFGSLVAILPTSTVSANFLSIADGEGGSRDGWMLQINWSFYLISYFVCPRTTTTLSVRSLRPSSFIIRESVFCIRVKGRQARLVH